MILRVESVSYNTAGSRLFNKKEKTILREVSFHIERGEILGISGESGSGKTTLAKIIAGIIKPSSGMVYYDFKEPGHGKINPVQILFQNNSDIINPFRRVEDIIKEILIKRYGPKESDQRFKKITGSLHIPVQLLKRRGLELSGGEQQRIAIARILAAGPELLIVDEPFSSQDPESQLNLLYLFKKINKEFGITIICITHHTVILRKLCDYIIIMHEGAVIEAGSTEDVFSNQIHPYTRWLFSAEAYTLTQEELQKREALTGSHE